MNYLNYRRLLSPQEGKRLGPDTAGNYYLVAQQMNDINEGTTTLGLVKQESK